MTEVTAKKFNWKKAVSVFFGVVIVLRVLMYLFGGSSSGVPECGSDFSKRLINKTMTAALKESGDDDIIFKFFNFKEVSSNSTSRVCKAKLTVEEEDGESQTVTKTFHIFKSKTVENKYYINVETGFDE